MGASRTQQNRKFLFYLVFLRLLEERSDVTYERERNVWSRNSLKKDKHVGNTLKKKLRINSIKINF